MRQRVWVEELRCSLSTDGELTELPISNPCPFGQLKREAPWPKHLAALLDELAGREQVLDRFKAGDRGDCPGGDLHLLYRRLDHVQTLLAARLGEPGCRLDRDQLVELPEFRELLAECAEPRAYLEDEPPVTPTLRQRSAIRCARGRKIFSRLTASDAGKITSFQYA